MSISNINRVQLAYIAETTFGTQKTGSNLQILRITSESFKQNTEIALSNEIRSDRQRADVVRTKVNVSGGMGFELSYASFDDFFFFLVLPLFESFLFCGVLLLQFIDFRFGGPFDFCPFDCRLGDLFFFFRFALDDPDLLLLRLF